MKIWNLPRYVLFSVVHEFPRTEMGLFGELGFSHSGRIFLPVRKEYMRYPTIEIVLPNSVVITHYNFWLGCSDRIEKGI